MKTSKKIKIGIVFGFIAGVIDIIPMILQKLTWDANLSAFSLWIIIAFIISTSTIKIHPILKGILISFLTLLPSSILIGWKEPINLIPIFIMTLILGGALGYFINHYGKN